ncbi:FCD domain-containing protein [uncultured Alistipes sp.]|jgi:transcriptional regulator|uniref:FadR/GntR family transcriptional regulator n=1 Tax=uncultured Alistipes sp. TaxID=538949 RepID=UPI0025DF9366|nr:FCD domain-containing protein [uncultured Alistipes sp.]
MMKQATNTQQVETVLRHIKEQLYIGRLKPGERLPAERRMAEQLGVSRAHVRTALQKLEFYGIVRTWPQSGTVVAQEKMQVLESMITDALKIDRYDFASLVYVRVLLEVEAIRLCARNRTEEDLCNIEMTLNELEERFHTDERVTRDYAFHQAIARGAHNPVIASLLLVITPDVIKYYQRYKVCAVPTEEVFDEHQQMLRCIREQDVDGAEQVLRQHLNALLEFSQSNNHDNHFLE